MLILTAARLQITPNKTTKSNKTQNHSVMSSFIIDKVEYVKAAGLMYGIESAKRDSHKYFMDVCRKEFEHV